jgi:hypothetical protein
MSLNELSDIYFEIIKNILFCEYAADEFVSNGWTFLGKRFSLGSGSLYYPPPLYGSAYYLGSKTLNKTPLTTYNENKMSAGLSSLGSVQIFFIRAFTIIMDLGKNYIKKVEELSKTLKDIPISEIASINATIKANLIKRIDEEKIGIILDSKSYPINKDFIYKRLGIDEPITDIVSLYNSVVTLFETINDLGYRLNSSLTMRAFQSSLESNIKSTSYEILSTSHNFSTLSYLLDPQVNIIIQETPEIKKNREWLARVQKRNFYEFLISQKFNIPTIFIRKAYFNYFPQLPSLPKNDDKKISSESERERKRKIEWERSSEKYEGENMTRFFKTALSLKKPLDFIRDQSINEMRQTATAISSAYADMVTSLSTPAFVPPLYNINKESLDIDKYQDTISTENKEKNIILTKKEDDEQGQAQAQQLTDTGGKKQTNRKLKKKITRKVLYKRSKIYKKNGKINKMLTKSKKSRRTRK